MNSKKLVSVLMSAFNSEESISNAIESIIRQEYGELELLIMDDGSKDNTFKINKEFCINLRKIFFVILLIILKNSIIESVPKISKKNINKKLIFIIDIKTKNKPNDVYSLFFKLFNIILIQNFFLFS